jgi:hypothetical protein
MYLVNGYSSLSVTVKDYSGIWQGGLFDNRTKNVTTFQVGAFVHAIYV